MSTATLPDVEAAVIQYLLGDSTLTALVDDRIYPERIDQMTYPVCIVSRISGQGSYPRWLDHPRFQVEGIAHRDAAGARDDAKDVAEAAMRALEDLANTLQDDTILCAGTDPTEPRPIPDQIRSGQANPRFIGELTVTYHPVLGGPVLLSPEFADAFDPDFDIT